MAKRLAVSEVERVTPKVAVEPQAVTVRKPQVVTVKKPMAVTIKKLVRGAQVSLIIFTLSPSEESAELKC